MLADPRVTLLSDDIADYCFIDTETRALPGVPVEKGNVKTAGAHEYSRHAKVIILTYAIGDGPVKCWALEDDLTGTLHWQDAPADLKAFRERAEARGDAWFVAWNAAFDRLAMNRGMVALTRRPAIAIPMTIDAMAQGVTSGLPTDLAGAARAIGLTQKVDEGKGLIGLFCSDGGATPASAPDEWARFIHYAEQDVAAMRDVFRATRQLPRAEWEVYWANEAINDRGLPFDRTLASRAAALSDVYEGWARGEVQRITGEDWGPKHHVALAGWAFDRLQHIPEAVDIMVKSYDTEDGDDGEPIRTIGKVSLDRARIEKLIPLLEARDERMGLTDDEFAALELCEVKLYSAGSTVQKFHKALPALGEDDRLRGQYVFNGAAQTGRFSSRGIQMHNLTRAYVGMETGDVGAEARAIDHMLDLPEEPTVHDLEQFTAAFGPAGRTLSRLIRPAILAPEGQEVVWGDYSNIEARVLPWLAASDGAERKLDIFRTTDRDPSAPDVYMIQAAATYGKRAEDVDKTERQTGKVQELSLGFGGGWRALLAMAANYRISLSREEAEPLVRAWRASNLWAVEFWSDVWRAAMLAMNNPGTAHTAGRLTYFFDGGHRGGSLFCLLPSQRLLTYPSLKYRTVEKVNEDGSTRTEEALTYMAGGARRTLWAGILVENATQAAAADLLRGSLVRIEDEMPGYLIGHTHDELIALSDSGAVEEDKQDLRELMTELPAWAEGMPVAAEVDHHEYYTKTKG